MPPRPPTPRRWLSPSPAPPTDVSAQALSVARLIDRLCRAPGRYTITLTVPAHRRNPWTIELHRLEPIRKMELRR